MLATYLYYFLVTEFLGKIYRPISAQLKSCLSAQDKNPAFEFIEQRTKMPKGYLIPQKYLNENYTTSK